MKEFKIKIDNEYIVAQGTDCEIGTEEPYVDGEQRLTIYNGDDIVLITKWKDVRYMAIRELTSGGIENEKRCI